MIAFSFNDPAGRQPAWRGSRSTPGSTRSGDPACPRRSRNSLIIAFLSTIIATILGTLIALALVRYHFRGRGGDQPAHLPADGDAGDRARGVAPDPVHRVHRRRRSCPGSSIRWHHDHPHRPHHVQHQLRGGDRQGPAAGLPAPSRGGGDGPRRERVDDVLEGDLPADPAGHHGRRPAGVQPVDRRLRHHELHGGHDQTFPLFIYGHSRGSGSRSQVNVIGTIIFLDRGRPGRPLDAGFTPQRRCATRPRPGSSPRRRAEERRDGRHRTPTGFRRPPRCPTTRWSRPSGAGSPTSTWTAARARG